METKDEDVLRLAKALAVDADADAVPLDGVSSEERMKLLERACSMRDNLELLIKQLINSARPGDQSSSRINPVGIIESGTMELDICTSTLPLQLGGSAASEPGQAKCCEHFCGYMDPDLWSTLPADLLQMVFARLPFPQMWQHLRLLSKKWKQSVAEGDCVWIRAHREANPKMLAMVFNSCGGRGSLFSGIFLYDFKANAWHFFRHFLPLRLETDVYRYNPYRIKCASGGLLCYVSPDYPLEAVPTRILECNPLTGQSKELPYHSLSALQPSMVQLVVNRDTKCYQVIVIVDKNRSRDYGSWNVAMVYDSATGAWSSRYHSCIFGYKMRLFLDRSPDPNGDRLDGLLGLCAFDGARHGFLKLDPFIEPSEPSFYVIDANRAIPGYALVEDRLFVLHRESQTRANFFILEYQAQTCKPNWVKVRTHECHPLHQCNWEELYTLRLDACEGCLTVTAYDVRRSYASGYKHERAWLYDLCTGEWKAIAPLEGLLARPFDCLMCELHWDVVP